MTKTRTDFKVAPFNVAPFKAPMCLVALLVALRMVGLVLSPLDLHGDEAQYFAWSRELAGGYFSKPPLIAWTLAASTALLGTEEWAIRIWSPLAHGLAALFVGLAARRLFDARTGAWSALAYLTLPGVVVSSAIASTDALLLCATAALLWCWAELREGGFAWRWMIALGVAAGLGLLSKYAMIFPLAGLALVWLSDRPTRAALPLPQTLAVPAIALALLSPNLVWNAANGFATASHTAANANLNAELLNPLEGLEFFASQFGVMGPVLFALWLGALVRGWREPRTRALAILSLVPFAVILLQAFVSRANANWSATLVVPGTVLVCAVWLRSGWVKAGVGVNAGIALVLTATTLSPALADGLGMANSYKRVRGWEATVAQLAERAEQVGARTIATDNRITFYALDYYGLGDVRPLAMWQMEGEPHNHAELTRPLREGADEPILFVNYHDEHLERVRADFAELREVEPLDVDLGGGKRRRMELYVARRYDRAERE